MSEQAPASDAPGPVPGTPGPGPDDPQSGGHRARVSGRALWYSLRSGNAFIITVLALITALVVGGLLNAFTNTTVLHAWGDFFSAPGHALALAWDTAVGAYVEMFEGSIFNPHTVAALFSQAMPPSQPLTPGGSNSTCPCCLQLDNSSVNNAGERAG